MWHFVMWFSGHGGVWSKGANSILEVFPTLMILGTERKREGTEAATTYQAETKPEVNFGGFSHGYGPLCIISASCAAASMLILKTGKHHRHTKKKKKLN